LAGLIAIAASATAVMVAFATVRFLVRARPLIDHALDVTRTERCAF
jgi:Na+-translocating ferredoxin:NAD+ oxidoreductase RNF subunit RnfB